MRNLEQKMNSYERYKRLIKLGFAFALVVFLTMVYGIVWIRYYNPIISYPFFAVETG